MTTYTYSSIEIVDGQVFMTLRGSGTGNGPADSIRITIDGADELRRIGAYIAITARLLRDTSGKAAVDKPPMATHTLVDALQTPSPARDEAMRQADARKGTE